jgi:hypothetical protein
MFLFEEIVKPPAMVVVDIGAMLLAGQVDPLARMSELGQLRVIGFEPQIDECQRLNARAGMGRTYLPYAIANGERRTLYVTNTGMTSSLLRPNLSVASHFNNLAELMQVVATPEIDTVRLDDVPEIHQHGCDLESEILEHARRILENCLIVQCEVEFIPLYERQALFAEVDQLLRGRLHVAPISRLVRPHV